MKRSFFNAQMTALAVAFPSAKVDASTFDVYWPMLKDIPEKKFIDGVEYCIKNGSGPFDFPVPGKLGDACLPAIFAKGTGEKLDWTRQLEKKSVVTLLPPPKKPRELPRCANCEAAERALDEARARVEYLEKQLMRGATDADRVKKIEARREVLKKQAEFLMEEERGKNAERKETGSSVSAGIRSRKKTARSS